MTRPNSDNIKKIYNAIAPGFYHMRQQPLTPELIKLAKTWKPGRLLDIGCGIGNSLMPFAKAGFDCAGLDISPIMLKYTKQYLNKHNIKAKLKTGNMTKLPFKKASFDYVICIAALHHLDSEKKRLIALKEIIRVLKKNVPFFLTVWNQPNMHGKDSYVPWNRQGRQYQRYYHFFSIKELETLMKKTGINARIYLDKSEKNICIKGIDIS